MFYLNLWLEQARAQLVIRQVSNLTSLDAGLTEFVEM